MATKPAPPSLLFVSASLLAGSSLCLAAEDEVSRGEIASTVVAASFLEMTSDARGELEKGEFELWCNDRPGPLARSMLSLDRVEFHISGNATVSAGERCYVNVRYPDVTPSAETYFPLGPGIYWGSSKGTVFSESNILKVDLNLFRASSSRAETKLLNFVVSLDSNRGSIVVPGTLIIFDCEGKSGMLHGQGRIEGGVIKSTIKAPTQMLGALCSLKFVTDDELRVFESPGKFNLAEVIGSASVPYGLHESVNGSGVSVVAAINVKGDCRVFSPDRSSCLWMMPDSCKVPMGEFGGSYEHGRWLSCISDAATVTVRQFFGDSGPISRKRVAARAIVEALQTATIAWNQHLPSKRAALIDTFLTEGLKVTATTVDESSLQVRDPAVVYGMEVVILPLLREMKEQLSEGVPIDN
jgi:hypothetical protein